LSAVAPSAPGAPVVTDSDINYIKLQWTAPETDGGAAVTGYYIERRDKNSGVLIRLNEDPVPVSSACGIKMIKYYIHDYFAAFSTFALVSLWSPKGLLKNLWRLLFTGRTPFLTPNQRC